MNRKWTNIVIWSRDRASILVQQLRIAINNLVPKWPNFVQKCQKRQNRFIAVQIGLFKRSDAKSQKIVF
jgi:hypothetical protein